MAAVDIVGVVFLLVRRHYKVQWINFYISQDYRDSANHLMADMYSAVILDADFGETDSRRARAKKILKHKQFCSAFLILEIMLMLLCPIPGFEIFIRGNSLSKTFRKNDEFVVYYLQDIIMAFMFLKLFFLFRVIQNYSIYADAFSKQVCKRYGISSNVRFAFKCYFI